MRGKENNTPLFKKFKPVVLNAPKKKEEVRKPTPAVVVTRVPLLPCLSVPPLFKPFKQHAFKTRGLKYGMTSKRLGKLV